MDESNRKNNNDGSHISRQHVKKVSIAKVEKAKTLKKSSECVRHIGISIDNKVSLKVSDQ